MLTLLTPTRTLHFEDGDLVVLMTKQGSEGFMYNHIPTLIEVVPGPIRYRIPSDQEGGETWRIFFVSVGYAEVQANQVTVVVSAAETPEEFEPDRAERALERAEKRLSNPDATELERTHAKRAIRRAQARIAFYLKYVKGNDSH